MYILKSVRNDLLWVLIYMMSQTQNRTLKIKLIDLILSVLTRALNASPWITANDNERKKE